MLVPGERRNKLVQSTGVHFDEVSYMRTLIVGREE